MYTLRHERIISKSSECTILMASQKKLLTVKELEGVIVYPEVLCCYAYCQFLFSHQMTDLSLEKQIRIRISANAIKTAPLLCHKHIKARFQCENASHQCGIHLEKLKCDESLTKKQLTLHIDKIIN